MFRSLEIQDWRQFAHVDIEFHDRLTLLTGANGAGKTTLLNLLNRHFGWSLNFVGTPRSGKQGLRFLSDLWGFRSYSEEPQDTAQHSLGSIVYTNGNRAQLTVPRFVSSQYNVNINGQQRVHGLFIPSHRPVYMYEQVTNIPTAISANEQLLSNYLSEIRNRFAANSRVRSASYRIKEALISLATFGYGNQAVARNDSAIETFEGFQEVLSQTLPKTLGFRKISIRLPEVVLETNSGEFSFDAVSGGVSAIIDMTWQLHIASIIYADFSVIIDEPENHLHPTLQKSLLPNFLEAFPHAHFIVATHNPLIVSSVPDSNVYVLDYNREDKPRVFSTKLDLVNKAASSNEILRSVLGLEHTKPIWVEQRLEQIVERYSDGTITDERLKRLRADMRALGLDHLFPEALSRVTERN